MASLFIAAARKFGAKTVCRRYGTSGKNYGNVPKFPSINNGEVFNTTAGIDKKKKIGNGNGNAKAGNGNGKAENGYQGNDSGGDGRDSGKLGNGSGGTGGGRKSDGGDNRSSILDSIPLPWKLLPGVPLLMRLSRRSGYTFARRLTNLLKGSSTPPIRVLINDPETYMVAFPVNEMHVDTIKVGVDNQRCLYVMGSHKYRARSCLVLKHELPGHVHYEKAKLEKSMYDGDLELRLTNFKPKPRVFEDPELVLSTASIDVDTLHADDKSKVNTEKSTAAATSDDVFESASFMTLVQPKGKDLKSDVKAAGVVNQGDVSSPSKQ